MANNSILDENIPMKQVKDFLQQSANLSDEDWEIFASKFEKQSFPKKTLLLNTGQIENYLSFIE